MISHDHCGATGDRFSEGEQILPFLRLSRPKMRETEVWKVKFTSNKEVTIKLHSLNLQNKKSN